MFGKLFCVVVLVCLSLPAFASERNPVGFTGNSVSVSTTSVQILPELKRRRYLLIQNVCANSIGISFTGTDAEIGTAGTVTLFPGGSWEFKDRYVPTNAINAISASGNCGITIVEIH